MVAGSTWSRRLRPGAPGRRSWSGSPEPAVRWRRLVTVAGLDDGTACGSRMTTVAGRRRICAGPRVGETGLRGGCGLRGLSSGRAPHRMDTPPKIDACVNAGL